MTIERPSSNGVTLIDEGAINRVAQFFAFTLLELLVVIGIIAILASLLLPALGRAKATATSASCLNNLKQLQVSWQMYVDDHGDFVPPNRSENTNGAWRSTPDSWIGGSSAIYDTDTKAIEGGLLFKYHYNASVLIYRCPGDKSKMGALNGKKGTGQLRTRSFSMSGCLGGRTNGERGGERGLGAGQRHCVERGIGLARMPPQRGKGVLGIFRRVHGAPILSARRWRR